MPVEHLTQDDSALLALWVRERREEAFAQLVATYQQMVVGAALRRTRDAEAARDVAQQVFATLAAKAAWLQGRQSIAGWLYHATAYLSAQTMRTESRRRAAITRLERESVPAGTESPVPWEKVEDSLAALSDGEREALVLHYFQDLGYPEMAARLGIAEPAARKRVSRGLSALEQQLARRGVRGAATLLLAGAVAQQSALGAPAGLAALATGGTATVPWGLTLSTMAKHLSVKITAGVAALLLVPLFLQWQSNAAAQAELDARRAGAVSPALVAAGPMRADTRLAELQAEIAAKRLAANATEKRGAELADMQRRVQTEVVYSLGTLDAMARQLAEVVLLAETADPGKKYDLTTEEGRQAMEKAKADAAKVMALAPKAISTLQELPEIERSPKKAGRFYATLYGELVGLPPEQRAPLEARAAAWVQQRQDAKLSLAQRPKDDSRKQWDLRFGGEMSTFVQTLTREFPGTKPLPAEAGQFFGPDGDFDTQTFDMLFGGAK